MPSMVVAASSTALGRSHLGKMLLSQRQQANIFPIVIGLILGNYPHTLAGDGVMLIRGNWETPLGSVTKLPIPQV